MDQGATERALTCALRKTVIFALVVAVAAMFVREAYRALLYAFAGLLLIVVIATCSQWVAKRLHLKPLQAYWVILGSFTALAALVGWFIAPRAIAQWSQITASLPEAISRLRNFGNSSFTAYIIEQIQTRLQSVGTHLLAIAGNAFNVLSGAVVALVIGLYGAVDIDLYRSGILSLFPEEYRGRAEEVFAEVAYTLKWWLFGQLVPMAVLGVATMIGLYLMHVPLAFTLGLFTALMIFIPYLGALMSGVPAALIALLQSPQKMIWVIVFYTCVHIAEGYALTPLVQRRVVRLPPVVTILAQLVMFTLTGLLGLALATPLAAAVLAVFRILVLHEKPMSSQGTTPQKRAEPQPEPHPALAT